MLIRRVTVVLAALMALPAAAQRMAPGLWEMSMQMPGGPDAGAAMSQMNERFAKMPPERRKQMEAMLAQHGVAPGAEPAGQPGATRVCISGEMAERGDAAGPDGRCKQEGLVRSANKVNFKFSCGGDPPSSGEGEYEFSGDKAYRGKILTNTVRAGKPVQMEMQVVGRFIGADCGDVKPRKHAPK